MRRTLFIDYETRSEEDLKLSGSHKYNMHPTTEMLLCAYAFDDEPVKVCEELPDEIFNAIEDDSILKIAHNAEFDMGVSKYVLGCDINFNDWLDSAYMAAYYGLPRSLKNVAKVLGTQQKGSQEELVLFSMPVKKGMKDGTNKLFFKPTETVWNTKETHPNEWEVFKEYAKGDVEVMREVYKRLHSLPPLEFACMQLTFEMNFNGVPIDLTLAKKIHDMSLKYAEDAGKEALEKYGIKNLKSVPQVKEALKKEGIYIASLNAKERGDTEHEILELRDRSSGLAFSKIPKVFLRICADERLRGEFKGFGAHTGRWSSVGVQMQNWARILEEVDENLTHVKNYSHLRQHMRLCIGNSPGMNFTCADESQIEARVTAWLADCKWRLTAFEEGEDIYSRSAERMFGIPKVTKGMPERHDGKCAELGFGFGGGSAAILRINASFYNKKGKAKVEELVRRWRDANPEICKLWKKLELGFRTAFKKGTDVIYCGGTRIVFQFDGKTMRISLPSGRALFYRGVHLIHHERGSDIYYTDYSDTGDARHVKIWGGTLTENIVQGLARDILVEVMKRMKESAPYLRIVGTVHDEIWYESRKNIAANPLEMLLNEMKRPISWAAGLPLSGDGFTHHRYIK